ncbi:hypothetical protein SAMN04487895_12853 [Paenibacillus sophorae]|uniref:Uncharacterized protein n=1 Tax=Paenibacillus sophorae TaxID=1333845 RepID=A0A1H8VX67_9BACL|nr:hypothetical protein [Paenibacillus sophorae]QWU15613.1 hypothetical protein KP014_27885 [Paenibacillus sophorae]SEP19920.1 hypothetical protein SAMN04487895_12853 [Paenibacillus sophorae]
MLSNLQTMINELKMMQMELLIGIVSDEVKEARGTANWRYYLHQMNPVHLEIEEAVHPLLHSILQETPLMSDRLQSKETLDSKDWIWAFQVVISDLENQQRDCVLNHVKKETQGQLELSGFIRRNQMDLPLVTPIDYRLSMIDDQLNLLRRLQKEIPIHENPNIAEGVDQGSSKTILQNLRMGWGQEGKNFLTPTWSAGY